MIRNVHTATLRELVGQAERDLAGYRRLLDLAEREERVGSIFPDPMAPASAPWQAPPAAGLGAPDQSPPPPVAGLREPYPATSVMPQIDGSTLPPSQEAAIGTIWAQHDQQAQTPKAHKEEQQWRDA